MPGGPAMWAGFPTARPWAFGFWCGVRPMPVGRFPLPLGLEKVMSKKFENLEKWMAFMLLAYAVGLRIGETIRDEVYRGKSIRPTRGS